MWEVIASGSLHPDLAMLAAPATAIRIHLGAGPEGRRPAHVQAHRLADGLAALLERVFPEFQQTHIGVQREEGVSGVVNPPVEDSLWSRLRALEAEWFGDGGGFDEIEIEDDRLRLRGAVGRPIPRPSVEDLAQRATASGLFDGAEIRVGFTPRPARGPAPDSALTDSEVATIRTALSLGYYDRPRRCTMDDIGAVLGISKSAVCHRMQAIEGKAIRGLLRGGPAPVRVPLTRPRGRRREG